MKTTYTWGLVACLVVGCGVRNQPSEPGPTLVPGPTSDLSSARLKHLSGHIKAPWKDMPRTARVPSEATIGLLIHLQADVSAMRRAVRQVSDPKSSAFHRYLTPDTFADRFGVSAAEYQSVIDWAKESRFEATTYRNRLAISVTGRAADVESAFHISLAYGSRADGTQFYAPSVEPSVSARLPIVRISNLDDYEIATSSNLDGTGTGGLYLGSDLRSAYIYNYASMTGANQTVAIVCLGNSPSQPGKDCCFNQSDINTYAMLSGLSGTKPVNPDSLDNSHCNNNAAIEPTGDIEMVTAIAPQAQIVLFGESAGGGAGVEYEHILESGIPTISSSWFTNNTSAEFEPLYDQMALQGQTGSGSHPDHAATLT